MSGAARRVLQKANTVPTGKLKPGGGYHKMMTEDDLPDMYPGSSAPLMQHATGVDVDKKGASVMPTITANTQEDLRFTPWEGKDVQHGSQLGMIQPYQYISDTVYKPLGLEDAAAKRLKNNPYFSAPNEDDAFNWANLLIHNSDYADDGVAGYAILNNPNGKGMSVGGYAPKAAGTARHEARHLITRPEIYAQPLNQHVSDAVQRSIDSRPLRAVKRGEPQSAVDEVRSNAAINAHLQQQQLDTPDEMLTHLGDANDWWVRTQRALIDTDEDARKAIEGWASQPASKEDIENVYKRKVILDAYRSGAAPAMNHMLRHMYAVPFAVGAGAAASQQQQQQSPLQGLISR